MEEKTEEKKSLGKLIALRRKYMRMTQEELAVKLGVSKSAVAKWETDGGIPDRDNLRRLSEVINISVDELYRLIDRTASREADLRVNITPDLIALLESYGYKVIRPGEDEEETRG